MHLRSSRVTRNGKTYEYWQVVESYRRPSDGMPMHRVIGKLGALTPEEVANFKAAIDASRRGKLVVATTSLTSAMKSHVAKPMANLRYLDLAVLCKVWRQAGLHDLLSAVLPIGDSEVDPASVVLALCLQRCVDPGSTLYAQRWFPRTALPELLGISPNAFNNTRLHRVLDALDDGGKGLMARLPGHLLAQGAPTSAMFLDVTDTWFVGDGPEMAKTGKTKEGLFRRKIGIVLLCTREGLPVRWEVVGGREADPTVMHAMLDQVHRLPWMARIPVVCDRAMGNTSSIVKLLSTGLHFVTALVSTQFDGYTTVIPHASFADVAATATEEDEASQLQAIRTRALEAGLTRVSDSLFVLELGRITRPVERKDSEAQRRASSKVAEAMRLGGLIDEALQSGAAASIAAAGRSLGLKKSLAVKYTVLTRLPEGVRRRIVAGEAECLSLDALVRFARRSDPAPDESGFEELLAASTPRRRNTPLHTSETPIDGPGLPTIRVRTVAYFNPEILLHLRRKAQAVRTEVEEFVVELNGKLAKPHARQKRDAVAGTIVAKLRRLDLLDAFDFDIQARENGDQQHLEVTLTFKSDAWARRHRYDGFCLLAAHPDVDMNAEDLCQLYRAKDAVEKDFQTIKSLVELRPVRHRTDAKVRAHVTLCVLSTLLERLLQKHLGATPSPRSAIETLEPCRLNRYTPTPDHPAYLITHPDPDQTAILRKLGMRDLTDDAVVAESLHPRQ